jgi:hypothetical protein
MSEKLLFSGHLSKSLFFSGPPRLGPANDLKRNRLSREIERLKNAISELTGDRERLQRLDHLGPRPAESPALGEVREQVGV